LISFLLRRLGASLFLLFLVLTLSFFFLHLLPGDPVKQFEGQKLTREQRANLERLYGLDRPLPEQYAVWISSFARGDWGTSLSQGRPVSTALWDVLPATMLLASTALAIEILSALLLGMAAALRRGMVLDHAIRVTTLFL
jgi:peptide/nickel transport system permease protein